MNNQVFLCKITDYDENLIFKLLPDSLFDIIKPKAMVVLKPNWVTQGHPKKPDEWSSVITHPTLISAVIRKVIDKLQGEGKIIITDGPQTDSSFNAILDRNPVDYWVKICKDSHISLEIIDLRDDEWLVKDGITIKRTKLAGDPKGSVEVNLKENQSEFFNHSKSKRGYYGADYNLAETNLAHDGHQNLYRVSRSVIEADVFINLPKLKTHKKGGITCCLKNLVGINTYKNYLPHHSEGSLNEGGDQFPAHNINARIEGPLVAFVRSKMLTKSFIAPLLGPLRKIGLNLFGQSAQVVRSGNWHGNDTLWRMILDLNKTFFYAEPNGRFRDDNFIKAKHYIGIVDAIIAGEGDGPMEPDPVKMNYIISGLNPVAIDAVAANLMGFDPLKISSIKNAFSIKKFKICNFEYKDITINFDKTLYPILSLPDSLIVHCQPHYGWKGHIERNTK